MVAVTKPEKEGYIPYPNPVPQPVGEKKRIPVQKPVSVPAGA